MTRDALADAFDKAAEALAQVAHELRGSEQPGAGGSVPPPGPPTPAAISSALGVCPVHRTAWTVKAGGISKNGKPYKAFWKCSGKNDDGSYCDQKPVKGWADSHPIPLDVVA